MKRVCEQPGVTPIFPAWLRTCGLTCEFSNMGETLVMFSRSVMLELGCEKLIRVGLNRMRRDKLDGEHTILNSFKEFTANVLEKQSSTERESEVNRRFL